MIYEILSGVDVYQFCNKYNFSHKVYYNIKDEIREKNIKIPNDIFRVYRNEEIIEDIKNDMNKNQFITKYKASQTLYYELKKEIQQHLQFASYQFKPRTAPMIYDIIRGMNMKDFCKKYHYKHFMYYKIKDEIREKNIPIQNDIIRVYRTPEMIEDIKEGMREKEFIAKHKSART